MSDQNNCIVVLFCGGALVVVGLLVILLPMSFSGLEYYEYGFVKQKSTGTVNLDTVYSFGKHFTGPDYEFKVFQADAHHLTLERIKAFTSDRLEVQVTVHLQYFLRKDDLPALHRRFDLFYEDVMKNSAVDAVKGAITIYTTRELISERAKVEEDLFKAVRERLGGKCCQEDCKSWKYACFPGCTRIDLCTEDNKGVFADVRFFQMGQVYIPRDVEERFLRQLTLKEDSEREKLLQKAQVERKITSSQVQKIKNRAQEVREEGQAESNLIKITSSANYTVTIEGARSRGLTTLYRDLGITNQIHKNSFDYLRTLRGLDNIWLTVDFNQRIVGSFGNN
ncbi:uncharacterized protein LOC133179122 [Saccostrea echinata]|uniref:uncharacterized protein LOC133179122 n=1 Tax=Saccostrea echinata TaxID=191078 RepID=UPI002A83FD7A|nr:uncharacterized protein LOC133179122 [Saccostrea echinata]